MKLEGIDEIDLNGILFVMFPDDMKLGECRDALELLIADAWDEDYSEGYEEDEKPEMKITPYWIWRAVSMKNWNEWRRGLDKRSGAVI